MPDTCGHLTCGLKIPESNQVLKKSKQSYSCAFLTLVNNSQLESPPKLNDGFYYSLQEVRYVKNGQN